MNVESVTFEVFTRNNLDMNVNFTQKLSILYPTKNLNCKLEVRVKHI